MSVYQRDSRYLVYWHENGKRHDKSFGRGEQARVLAEQFDQALKTAKEKNCPLPDADLFLASSSSGADSGVLSAPAPSGMPSGAVTAMPQGICLLELGEKYLTHMQASGRTAKHIHNVANLIRNHFVPILGNKPVEAITYQDDIIPFIIHYQGTSATTGKARSQYTVNKYCDYLSFIFNFGIANNLCQHNPLKNWKKPKVQQWDLQLTLEDAKKIMAHAEPHLRWAMEVCFNLGTRPGESELLSLRWDHINFEAETIRIYASKTKTYRTVPIHPDFLGRLKEMQQESTSGYIVEYQGRKLTTIRKAFKNACQHAGITYHTRMYDLRHLFATTLLSKGADLAAVSKMMGHSTVKMTADTYYHYMEGEKERAVRLLPQMAV